ncbi:uncharacterized protein LOC111327799 [Stylophora pistillata]|uniref:RING-type E3 ubiquitin transferase n=1 Tax=Stylophora pistillata TaxID=50429 RepID=A0A2B4SBS8_STYPI|nr:uncharacterized protein LOC111327799 [Stylophora pistillata]PFX27331.1 E3 ubiquitin-protein ligase DTX3L [Stylophora pistillata]
MAEMNDHPESIESQLGRLSVEKFARAVVISNIPRQITKDEIHIHFQKSKNGGGEVDDIWMTKDGKAVIVFESPEVADGVLKHPHMFGGKKVDLRPYRNQEVFSHVTAFVSFDTISPQKSENLLKMVKDEVGVSWQVKGLDGFVLSGTINQLEIAHRYLQKYFLQRPHLLFKEERMVQGKDAIKTLQNSAKNLKQVKKDPQEIVEERTFEVEPKFMKFFIRVHKEKLEQIEREYHLKIIWPENEPGVDIKPTSLAEETHYQEGCDAFIDLYQTIYHTMKRQVIDVRDIHDDGKIKEAIAFVESKHPVVIEKAEGQLIIYSEDIHLKSSVKALKNILGLSKLSGGNLRNGQRNISHSPHHHEPPLPKILQQMLTNNVMVSLYQGDITDEKVHAIVNPANPWLQHSQGVGGAIVIKGGSQIVDESRCIMSHRKFPLQPGEAVYTLSGHLSCHYVIHTIGPDWSAYPDKSAAITVLRLTCITCLRLAVQLRLSSIAFPAISSGNCGMPKEACAGAIFRAIEEFSTSIDAECSTLRDIRVVIIDAETTEVFRREFVNRYYSEQKLQNQMEIQRRPSKEEGNSPFSTNRGGGDPRIDDELLTEKCKSTQDSPAEPMRKQDENDSHQRVEEQHQQNSKESNLKADEMSLADSLEAQNVGGSKNETKHKDEGQDTGERSDKTTKSSGNSVPARGILAPSFFRKGGDTNGTSFGRAMSFKATSEIKHPPGLSATKDNLNLAKQLEAENNEQFTDASDVNNVNQPDANKEKTKEDENKPPDKSKEGSKRESSASDPVHSNSSAPKTEKKEREKQMALETAPNTPNVSASNRAEAPNDVPLLATGTSQGPEEKELMVSASEASTVEKDEDQSQGSQTTLRCSICRNSYQELVEPRNCGHTFCQSCIDNTTDGSICSNQWCICERSQPIGSMAWRTEKQPLPGYPDYYSIAVTYNFPSGTQGWEHPTPGHPYHERFFTAYLPSNHEGRKLCELLKRAFDARLLFRIGKCQATGEENQIVCNGIKHKINRSGGAANHGYPDPTYLERVKKELVKIGIVEDTDLQV